MESMLIQIAVLCLLFATALVDRLVVRRLPKDAPTKKKAKVQCAYWTLAVLAFSVGMWNAIGQIRDGIRSKRLAQARTELGEGEFYAMEAFAVGSLPWAEQSFAPLRSASEVFADLGEHTMELRARCLLAQGLLLSSCNGKANGAMYGMENTIARRRSISPTSRSSESDNPKPEELFCAETVNEDSWRLAREQYQSIVGLIQLQSVREKAQGSSIAAGIAASDFFLCDYIRSTRPEMLTLARTAAEIAEQEAKKLEQPDSQRLARNRLELTEAASQLLISQ